MPEEPQKDKDIRQAWARITRGGADALDTSLDFGRLALYAYVEGRESVARENDADPQDSAGELTGMATAAALQSLAHVQRYAAEQQAAHNLLQFAALEGMGIPIKLRQQAAQMAAEALDLAEYEEYPVPE